MFRADISVVAIGILLFQGAGSVAGTDANAPGTQPSAFTFDADDNSAEATSSATVSDYETLVALHPNLSSLECDEGVTDDCLRQVGKLKELDRLIIDGCKVVEIQPTYIDGVRVPNSKVVYTVTDAGIKLLSNCIKLKILSVNANLGDDCMSTISGFTSLETLQISDSHIGDEALKQLASLNMLHHLDLIDDANISDEGVQVLASIPSLTDVSFRHSCAKITDEGIEALNRRARNDPTRNFSAER